jgi:hypothetical protein
MAARWVCGMCLGVLTGCGDDGVGLPSGLDGCGNAPFLTVSPLTLSDIDQIAPLGNLNPPGHVFPTDHMYFYPGAVIGGTRSVPLVSPGNVVTTEIVLNRRTGGGLPASEDYSLTFAACSDVLMTFAHVTTLAASFAARVGALDGSCDPAYQTGDFTNQQCRERVEVQLMAGEPIGTTGGPMQGGLDYTTLDRRVSLGFVNPGRSWGTSSPFGQNQASCALDYFVAPVADSLRARLGRPGSRRTAPPVCGEIMQDVPGTAAGRWYRVGVNDNFPEDPHLALVRDNYNPSAGAFSVGTSVPSLPPAVYLFTPAAAGLVNLDFPMVATVGMTYCYETTTPPGQRRILLMLVSPTRVRVQGFGTGACGDPSMWVFDQGAAEFQR